MAGASSSSERVAGASSSSERVVRQATCNIMHSVANMNWVTKYTPIGQIDNDKDCLFKAYVIAQQAAGNYISNTQQKAEALKKTYVAYTDTHGETLKLEGMPSLYNHTTHASEDDVEVLSRVTNSTIYLHKFDLKYFEDGWINDVDIVEYFQQKQEQLQQNIKVHVFPKELRSIDPDSTADTQASPMRAVHILALKLKNGELRFVPLGAIEYSHCLANNKTLEQQIFSTVRFEQFLWNYIDTSEPITMPEPNMLLGSKFMLEQEHAPVPKDTLYTEYKVGIQWGLYAAKTILPGTVVGIFTGTLTQAVGGSYQELKPFENYSMTDRLGNVIIPRTVTCGSRPTTTDKRDEPDYKTTLACNIGMYPVYDAMALINELNGNVSPDLEAEGMQDAQDAYNVKAIHTDIVVQRKNVDGRIQSHYERGTGSKLEKGDIVVSLILVTATKLIKPTEQLNLYYERNTTKHHPTSTTEESPSEEYESEDSLPEESPSDTSDNDTPTLFFENDMDMKLLTPLFTDTKQFGSPSLASSTSNNNADLKMNLLKHIMNLGTVAREHSLPSSDVVNTGPILDNVDKVAVIYATPSELCKGVPLQFLSRHDQDFEEDLYLSPTDLKDMFEDVTASDEGQLRAVANDAERELSALPNEADEEVRVLANQYFGFFDFSDTYGPRREPYAGNEDLERFIERLRGDEVARGFKSFYDALGYTTDVLLADNLPQEQ